MRVGGHVGQNVDRILAIGGGHDRRGQPGQHGGAGGHIAVVALVAAAEPLGPEFDHVEAVDGAERRIQHGTGDRAHPAEPIQRRRIVGAEAQRLAQSLVEWRERPGPLVGLHHDDGNGGRHHPRHGPDPAVVVAGGQRQAAPVENPGGRPGGVGLPFQHQRPDEGATEGTPDAPAAQRRAGVQVPALADRAGHLAGRADADRPHARRVERLHRRQSRRHGERRRAVVTSPRTASTRRVSPG